MPTPQVQWYKSIIVVGQKAIPCYPPAVLVAPENDVAPPILGNYAQLNTGDGLIQPYFDVALAVRDKAGEVLSADFLGLFWNRSNDSSHDTSVINGGVKFWDGYKGWALSGVKADSFTIASSKGDDITFRARFVFTGMTALTSAPTEYEGWDTSRLLRFNAVSFGGSLQNRPWSFALSFSNNHHPDMALDGTRFPAAYNAGMVTAGLQITVQAQDDVAVPGMGTVPDETAISITIAGTGRAVTFDVVRPRNQNKRDRAIQPPRIMRQHAFLCLAGTWDTAPVTFTSTF